MVWLFHLIFAAFVSGSLATCPAKCICNKKQKFVNCKNAGLETVPWNLPDPVGLERLDLSGNDIKDLLSEIVSYRNLISLDLSNNGMVNINGNVFDSLTKLKILNLKNNHLDNIDINIFKGLHAAEILDISYNNLKSVQDNVFADLTLLEVLDLSQNMIKSVTDAAFSGLTNLKTLKIGQNALSAIPSLALKRLSNLGLLQLNGNRIEAVAPYALSGIPLHEVILDGNQITSIDALAFGNSKSQSKIQKVSLCNNLLDHVPSSSLSQLIDLITIDLSSNPITIIDPDAFKGLYKLEEVYIQYMPHLEVIRSYAFSELAHLWKVQIHTCPKLRTIEKDAFLASTSIHHVDLHSNALSVIDVDAFEWSKVKYLDLRNNPWICDCRLEFLPGILQSVSNESLTAKVMCSQPEDLAESRIVDLSADMLKCEVQVQKIKGQHYEDKIIIAVIALTSVILLAVMVVLMFCSRNTVFGTGQYPVVYRAPPRNQATQNGNAGQSSNDENASEDRYPIANNEEHPNRDEEHGDVQL